MKITLAQINPIVNDLEGNFLKIKNIIIDNETTTDLIVFPELSICGYPPKDTLLYIDFIKKCYNYILEIKNLKTKCHLIIGTPYLNEITNKVYNSAFLIFNGNIIDRIDKTLLPNYNEFDEKRYFTENNTFKAFKIMDKLVGISICEDIWNIKSELNPINELKKLKINLLINISASPYNINKFENRYEIIKKNAIFLNSHIIYVNQVGGNSELIFDGNSLSVNNKGNINYKLKSFEEDVKTIELSNEEIKFEKENINTSIIKALTLGIKDYFNKNKFTKAIIGLSGGIDSALVTYLACNALGNKNVLVYLLPSQYSSKGSLEDSIKLAKILDIKYEIISIKNLNNLANKELEQIFKQNTFGIAEENIQSRLRCLILMAISNKFGYILLNTSNKSELAVGYGTLYGDMAGSLSVIGDVYKSQIYEICKEINKNKEIIPNEIIIKEPSAELKPNQKDSDSLPDYLILDKILYQYIEEKKSYEELLIQGYEKKLLFKIINLINKNEFKRYQSPPILKISNCSFGFERRMPLTLW